MMWCLCVCVCYVYICVWCRPCCIDGKLQSVPHNEGKFNKVSPQEVISIGIGH